MKKIKQKYRGNIISIYFATFTFLAAGYEFYLSYFNTPYVGEARIYHADTGQNLCNIPVIIEDERRYEKGIITRDKNDISVVCKSGNSNENCIASLVENREKLKPCLEQHKSHEYIYQIINKSKAESSFHFLLGAGFFFTCLGFASYYKFSNLKHQSTYFLDEEEKIKKY